MQQCLIRLRSFTNQVFIPSARYVSERGQGRHERIRRSLFSNLHNSFEMRYLRDWIFVLLFVQIRFLNACNSLINRRKWNYRRNIDLFMHMPRLWISWHIQMTLNWITTLNIVNEIFSEELDKRSAAFITENVDACQLKVNHSWLSTS